MAGLGASSVLAKSGKVNVTVGGSGKQMQATTMTVGAAGKLSLRLSLGGGHGNDWYYVKLNAS